MTYHRIEVEMGEDLGHFEVDTERDKIIFSSPVLDEIEYMPPSVTSYMSRVEREGDLRRCHLSLEHAEQQKAIFLRGAWKFSDMEADQFDSLLIALKETAEEIKGDLYAACCKDLIYVVAHHAYSR
jgi:hypothetical protein